MLLRIVVGVVSLVFLVQVLMSLNLWLQVREYPLVPAFEFIPLAPYHWLGLLMFCGLFFTLAGMNILRSRRFAVFGFLVMIFIYLIFDINRLQAWVFMYILLFIPMVSVKRDNKNTGRALDLMRLVILFIYFWSGLHKINMQFVENAFPWMLSGMDWMERFDKPAIAWFVPFAEMAIAGLLLFRRTRIAGIALAGLFHLIILFLLGPLGHDWNDIVWPWNILMAILVFLLFKHPRKEKNSSLTLQWPKVYFFPMIPVVILAGVMPALHFTGNWDSNISFSMYTGLSDEALIFFEEMEDNCIPNSYDHLVFKDSKGVSYLSLDDWSMETLRVPAYSSVITFKRLAGSWCNCVSDPEAAGLEILRVRSRWERETEFVKFTCENLRQ